MNPDWLVPRWRAPGRVHALCTTRVGGASTAPFDSLNLGDHVGDGAANVAVNRSILAQATGTRPVFLSQVHGSEVLSVSAATPAGTRADGCITRDAGVACTIMVADCLPVLLTTLQGDVVAAAHAGWRGLAGRNGHGIIESVLQSIRLLMSVDKAQAAPEIIAWLGPCIGPQAFEVGADVHAAFVSTDAAAQTMFATHGKGKWLADLAGLARLRLGAAGVRQVFGNDGNSQWCTASQPSRFYSHRRDRVSGRMAACIWLD